MAKSSIALKAKIKRVLLDFTEEEEQIKRNQQKQKQALDRLQRTAKALKE